MKKLAITAVGLTSLLASTTAQAEDAQAPFNPSYEANVAEFPWESAWLPNEDAAVRVQLTAAARQDVTIDMLGDANYDWDGQELIFRGAESEGEFTNTVDLDVTVNLHVGFLGSNIDSEIGVYKLEREVMESFTPYVLEGNADAPVEIAQVIGPFNLVNAPFTISDSISGVFTLDFQIDTPGVSFQGTRIEVDTAEGSVFENMGTVTTENTFMDLAFEDAEPGGSTTVYGTEYGVLNSELSVRLMPAVTVYIGAGDNPVEVNIGPFDVAVEYPLVEDQEIEFDAIALNFDVPAAPEPEGGDSSSGGDPSESESEAGDSSSGDAPEPEPEDDTDGSASDTDAGDETGGPLTPAGAGAETEGCGCQASSPSQGAAWSLLSLFGLVAFRRRR